MGTALVMALATACGSPPSSYAEVVVDSSELSTFLGDKPVELRPHYERLLKEGRRNEALNSMELGLIHFERGEFDLAAKAFDGAIAVVETFYVDDSAAEAARSSSFADEDIKDFKGEPYERVMLYYYRGLTHIAQGKMMNARASFRMAAAHDAIAEDEQHRCDFASMLYLQGVLALWDGDQSWADICFRQVEELLPDVEIPRTPPSTLLIAEAGACPVKIVDGVEGQRLTMHRNRRTVAVNVAATANGQVLPIAQLEDVYWQSSTRGGRFVDSFLDGKARWKSAVQDSSVVGTELAGSIQGLSQAMGESSGAFAAAGAVFGLRGAFGGKIRAKADQRHWRNLPQTLHIGSVEDPLSTTDLDVQFFDEDGRPISGPATSTELEVSGGRRVLWVRNRTAFLQPISNR